VDNTSLSPAASNIIVACDCGLPLHPAVPRVIGFQIEIKENTTPGDEYYLDPPGAELLAWSKN
jgi:hypothetical protein